MHQPCECRTVYHSWKHCSFHFSMLHRSPVVVNQLKSFLRLHQIYDWVFFCIYERKLSVNFFVVYGVITFQFGMWKKHTCAVAFSVYPEDLILFTDINCLACIDFSNSNLCCGLVLKPTHRLTSTVLIPTIVDLLSCVMTSFVFWSKHGRLITDAECFSVESQIYLYSISWMCLWVGCS